MRACVLRGERLVVDEVPEPRPAAGQVLVRSVACGICGSDVHFLRHARAMVDLTEQLRPSLGDIGALAPPPIDLGRDIVMGHEFCAEVLEHGPGTTGPPPGTLVGSMPGRRRSPSRWRWASTPLRCRASGPGRLRPSPGVAPWAWR